MNNNEIIVKAKLFEGVSSKTGNEYSFYTFKADIEGLEVEFVVKDRFQSAFVTKYLKGKECK